MSLVGTNFMQLECRYLKLIVNCNSLIIRNIDEGKTLGARGMGKILQGSGFWVLQ